MAHIILYLCCRYSLLTFRLPEREFLKQNYIEKKHQHMTSYDLFIGFFSNDFSCS